MLTRKARNRAIEQEKKYRDLEAERVLGLQRSWYCDQCAVEVYDRCCKHCGKTRRQRT